MKKKKFRFRKKKRNNHRKKYSNSGQKKWGNSNQLQDSRQVLQKYDNLLERHLDARRKYYDYFHRANEYKRKKLEQNFYATLQYLRRFESALNSQQKKWLEMKTNNLNLDTIYSENHNLSSQEKITGLKPENPHLLPSQKQSNFSQDREESIGTMEDYKRIKEI